MPHSTLRITLSTLVIVLINATPLAAQLADLKLDHLTVAQGLSSNEVTAILQDTRGFMWFATANGLNKYDGYSFTTYKTDPLDTASISDPWINLLYEDTHGDLWITTGGLNRFDRATGRISRHLSDRHITSICEDTSAGASEVGVWFTTLGQGIYRYDRKGNRFAEYRHNPNDSNSISSDSTFCACLDVGGTLWIGSTKGLTSLDKSRGLFSRYAHGPQGSIYTVSVDPGEPTRLLWVGTSDGLYVYDIASGSFAHYRNDFGNPHRPEDNDVRTVYRDRKGRLWVGMMGGIARFDCSTRRFTSYQGGLWTNTWGYVNKAWTICEDRTGTMWMVSHWGPLRKYHEEDNEWTPVRSVSDHDITFHAVCEDKCGTMWFGTVADGVLKLDRARKPFSVYTRIPGDSSSLSSAIVTGICEDASGTLWVATLRGLNRLNASTGTFTHYQHDERDAHSLSNDVIWPILEDRRGTLWVGSSGGGGLDEFDRSRQRFVHHRNDPGNLLSLPNNLVEALCEGRDGTIWVGTDDGIISEYAPASNIFRRHIPGYIKSGDAAGQLNAILEDHSGLIWVAAPPTGLNSYDRRSDRWTRYVRDHSARNQPGSIVAPGTLSLCEDRRGMLWVGTDEGLFKFDKQTGTFTRYGVRDGLADDVIEAILEDGKGCLWLRTPNGLSQFDPDNGSVRNYDASDGVGIGPPRLPGGHKNKNGEMFFGGTNGFVRFHPDSIQDNPHVPPIVITAFRKFDAIAPLDSAISEKRLIAISYKENMFSFEFAALNFTSPEKNQYAYRLEGFDKEWRYCGTQRHATYTNLDGGRYVFRVKGSNNDGVWNEQGTSIVVVITPPFWSTWWFRAFALVAVFGSVGGTIRYIEIRKLKRQIERLEQERVLEQERTRISQDMHDEVGAGLTEIGILSELAKMNIEKPGEAAIHLQRVSETSRETIASIGEIIWAINPKNDLLDDLVAYLRQYTARYLGATAIKLEFDIPEAIPDFHISAEARRNVFLVMKEALHNIVKHSEATAVLVQVSFTKQHLDILVKDNGKGFSAGDTFRFGNGLHNMEKRMKRIGGRFIIESRPGEGTSVSVAVDL